MKHHLALAIVAAFIAGPAHAVDLELFEFGDPNDTQLTAAANTANPGNQWFYDEEATTPGVASTGDVSEVDSGVYRVLTDSTFAGGLESRFLDIANVSSGKVFLSATLSSWNFLSDDGTNVEQFRFTFLDDDTGNSGSTVTAQVQIRRNPSTGSMELVGDAIGTAGAFDIPQSVDLPNLQTAPFTMVLALDKDANSYEVFYKEGTNPSQSLGLGGVSRARDANSVRMVTANFGADNGFGLFNEFINVDRFAVVTTNPLTDLITLEVNRETGAMTLVNTSGAAVTDVTGVTLESNSLTPADEPLGAIDLTDFVDFSGTLADGQSVALDSSPGSGPGLWLRSPIEDVSASLAIAGGDPRTLDVDFVGNGGAKWESGDLDFDGVIDANDYVILTASAEADLSALSPVAAYGLGDLNFDGKNDAIDFGLFKDAFIDANGVPAFAELIAGVPEPGAATLVLLAGAFLGLRRRSSLPTRQSPMSTPKMPRTMLPVVAAIAASTLFPLGSATAQSVLLHDFRFDDPFETDILNLTDSAGTAFFRDVDSDNSAVVTNGLGQLDLSTKNNDGFGSNNLFDLTTPITEGLVFGVLEATWDFQSPLNPSENEQLRLSLISTGNSTVTAEVEIERTDNDVLVIGGQAIGGPAGNTPTATLNGGSLTQTSNFVAVVQADLTADTYEVFFSNDNFASFASAGTGLIDPARGVTSGRLVMNNDFSNDNVLIDRVRIFQNELPFELDPAPPELLTLLIHPKSGHAGIVNDTGNVFDIDYYRVQSGDDSLLPGEWRSLQDQKTDAVDGPDGGATPGDGVGETWTEAGGSDAGVLSESFLLSSSLFVENDAVPLGRVFDLAGDETQLTFEFRDPVTGDITIGNVLVAELLPGDFNVDGRVDAADYTVWRDNASGLLTPADYDLWADNYGASLGSAVAIPEPTAIAMIAVAASALIMRRPS